MLVEELGYELAGHSDNSDTALVEIQKQKPDLLLVDININGTMDGVELMETLQRTHELPIIFVTSFDDKETFSRTKVLKPFAYIVKPFHSSDLERSIELAFSKSGANSSVESKSRHNDSFFFENAVFVKQGSKIEKVMLDDINYCEVDSNYSTIHTSEGKKLVVRMNLDDLNNRMPQKSFLRVNRKYSINLLKISSIDLSEQSVMVGNKEIPIGRAYKDDLISKLELLK